MISSLVNADPAAIASFVFAEDEMFPADLAIVFGMTAWHLPLARALELYRAGMVRTLVFTGGFNKRIQTEEATAMARAAIAAGIPGSDLIVDADSSNTTENVLNAHQLIDNSLGLENVNAMLLVAIHFHMRRARLTVEQIFPTRIRIGCASYPSAYYSRSNWYLSDKGRHDVLAEACKIEKYFGGRVFRPPA